LRRCIGRTPLHRWRLFGKQRHDDELQPDQRACRRANDDIEAFPFFEAGHGYPLQRRSLCRRSGEPQPHPTPRETLRHCDIRGALSYRTSRMPAKTPRKTPPRELETVLDFVRYAASRFVAAKLAFGQGTRDAIEDAMFLVCEALYLPKD